MVARAFGVGFNSVWTCYGSDVVGMDLDPFAEVARIPAGKTAIQGHLATGFDRVWIRAGADVRHVDAASGMETSAFTLDLAGPSPGDMLVAFGALWTSASEDATLFRIAIE